ncbi:4-keto-6-deoxy-N-Acetyl-D-hexosaminyl-(Lipid carrier) aminotransferase [Halanaerobium saccharolyticum subsp. saccharolyticum DSM 6643]|uniref:4-keto-6-deoxy-N-Acetyl-D-hexosaminyl-(Lipid carrier) aminotransferase n=1 Tax=Halanaerobium saccharolyticum subsp. saccharolyticum DSM 6643 TaxID=1293054 RepID=M5DXH7_9FIRM|nr:dTDP-4-amino-4,6-dideoxygalactose transaminase [Halanaerobium saccharolyticum]CCU78074.1 4-keto-6-deoxy-N-Acetyl-D-hexosaminyl-(Lipid carrier) aminotransferase [Halanaerobium saccharolyticum subsp. saccharolyticum DSM 6643]
MRKIDFHKIYLSGNEKKYIEDALNKGNLSGDGFYTKKVSEFLENKFDLIKVLMTTSATHALEMAAQLIDLKEGDEVIMPSFSFSSTANAVIKTGAKPVFAEVKLNNFNLDPADFESKITARTKAVIPVHYAGISCEMKEIKKIAKKNNIYIIEDAAHAVNSFYQGKAAGSMGDFGCYSFHGSKNFVSGEGGAIIINSDQHKLIEKAEIIREKGTNRSSFLRGEIDKYNWVGKGSSYLPSDILMALLLAQLEQIDYITKQRRQIFEFYNQHLEKFLNEDFLEIIPQIPEDRQSNYHLYYLKLKNQKIRDFILKKLRKKGIETAFHFQPLHASPMGKKLGYQKRDLQLTNDIAASMLRLPIYPGLSAADLNYIIAELRNIFLEIKQAGV